MARDKEVTCQYCVKPAHLVTGASVFPYRADLADKHFFECAPCGAFIGCHPGTLRPLGRLANRELRAAKVAAHTALDEVWKSGAVTRGKIYKWLAGQLGIKPERCHIGKFDVATCKRTVEVCEAWLMHL